MWRKVLDFVFGEPLHARLPDRVRRSIEAQQIESEILIGWFQLALVLFFSALYTIAPKTSAGTGFSPVPWALALYLVFTVVRLAFSYRVTLPPWVLVSSVMMDMALLMVLIWSFHIQYEQPASFYLKAPTMLYVFIFIALRSLRFDPRYVMAAGLVAAAGWLALILYVLVAVPGDPMITRDYVEYLTSNSILIGAELDKIVTIVVVTGILAVAIMRAQRLLDHAILDSTAARDLSKFVSPEIAQRITTADKEIQAGDGEIRDATVLFTDIEGFSTISERMPPDELMRTLNDYFSAMTDVFEGYNGVLTHVEGDAMMIGFNTVKPDPDHARNGVMTAIGIQNVVNGRTFGNGITLKTRCGINTGKIITGAIGARDRLIFTMHGDEVNIAARLEQLNKEYGTYILASDHTVDAAGGGFPFEQVGEVTVRGRSQPTCVFAIREIPRQPTP